MHRFFLFLLLCLLLPLQQLVVFVVVVRAEETTETNNDNNKNNNNNKKNNKVAVVTLLTTSDYIAGAEVLLYSLNRVKAKGDRILLYVGHEEDDRSDLTSSHMETLRQAGWNRTIALTKESGTYTECQVSEEHRLLLEESAMKRYWGTCSKFAIWTLTEYDAIVYIDADSLVLNNFDFVYELVMDNKEDESYNSHTLYAQGTPGCWEVPIPDCREFYSAFLVLRPYLHISQYFHTVAQTHSSPNGDIELLNALYQSWQPLPRYTMVAQTEHARPFLEDNNVVNWSVVKVYDFAGMPMTKPWNTYRLQKETKNKYAHYYFTELQPDSSPILLQTYLYPQWKWNEYYDQVLLQQQTEESKKEDSNNNNKDDSCASVNNNK